LLEFPIKDHLRSLLSQDEHRPITCVKDQGIGITPRLNGLMSAIRIYGFSEKEFLGMTVLDASSGEMGNLKCAAFED
jgi:hypothetical protein